MLEERRLLARLGYRDREVVNGLVESGMVVDACAYPSYRRP